VGIGDDAAILPPSETPLVWTCDAVCDGVHFRSTEHEPEQIGYKALAACLSDLAAMGAAPAWATVTLVLPRCLTLDYVKRLYAGMRPLADRWNMDICGGDTTVWDGGLAVSAAAAGYAPAGGCWRLDAAKPGDRILVTGSLGGSILGRHLSFVPRCDFASRWANRGLVRACTDISDSLSMDLAKLATASGTGFEIDADAIPVSDDARRLAESLHDTSPLDHALSDGEDFELIVIAPPQSAQLLLAETNEEMPLTDIGVVQAGGAFRIRRDGRVQDLHVCGWQHEFGGTSCDPSNP
jgi:thiamine-monophosphate kinase